MARALFLRTVLTNLIVFGISLSIPLLAFVVIGVRLTPATLLVVPALALIILSALAASAFFGIACARYRDLYPLLQAVMRVLFFVTPVLWSPALLAPDSPRRLIADLNPLAHYVAIWRQPLMGEYPDALSWLVTSGCTIVGLCIAFAAFAAHRQKLIFWV
jgi:ABC-type polysaccharide/polyol phosphate export permease